MEFRVKRIDFSVLDECVKVELRYNTELSDYDKVYASMIESMDKSLGDIMHILRKLDIEKNNSKSIELTKILSDYLRESKTAMSFDKRTKKLVEYPDEIILTN